MPYDQSQEPKLRVLPRGSAMVPDYEHLEETMRVASRGAQSGPNAKRFHGRHHDPNIGAEYDERDAMGRPTGKKARQGGYRASSEVVTLPMRGEYLRHLRDRDLWPADQETARLAGVPFDPNFGGEHDIAPKASETATRKA